MIEKQSKKKAFLIAAAVAGMLGAGALAAGCKSKEAKADSVACAGANSCKGHSACKSSKNDCAGKNGCKGQGFAKVASAEACTSAGGSVIANPMEMK